MGHEDHDLQLAISEVMRMIGTVITPMMCRQGVECLLCDPPAEVDLPLEDLIQGLSEELHRLVLMKVSKGSRPEASLCVEILTLGGIDEDLEFWIQRTEILDKLEAILSRKLNLKNEHCRCLLGQLLHGFFRRGAGPSDFPAVQLLDVAPEADPRGCMAVDDGDPSFG